MTEEFHVAELSGRRLRFSDHNTLAEYIEVRVAKLEALETSLFEGSPSLHANLDRAKVLTAELSALQKAEEEWLEYSEAYETALDESEADEVAAQ